MSVVSQVLDRDGVTVFWEQDPDCGGFTIDHDTCYLRNSEMLLVPYTPIQCLDPSDDCGDLVAYVRYNIQSQTIQQA